MNIVLSVMSFLVYAAALGLGIMNQEKIPLFGQILITLVLTAYQIMLQFKIFKREKLL